MGWVEILAEITNHKNTVINQLRNNQNLISYDLKTFFPTTLLFQLLQASPTPFKHIFLTQDSKTLTSAQTRGVNSTLPAQQTIPMHVRGLSLRPRSPDLVLRLGKKKLSLAKSVRSPEDFETLNFSGILPVLRSYKNWVFSIRYYFQSRTDLYAHQGIY